MLEVAKKHAEQVAEQARGLIGQERGEWGALQPSTVAEKARLGYFGQVSSTDPLLRTGDMRDSVIGQAQETVDGVEGIVGSESKIALWQELGTSRIPPRPFMSTALKNAERETEKRFGHLGIRLTNPTARYLPES